MHGNPYLNPTKQSVCLNMYIYILYNIYIYIRICIHEMEVDEFFFVADLLSSSMFQPFSAKQKVSYLPFQRCSDRECLFFGDPGIPT